MLHRRSARLEAAYASQVGIRNARYLRHRSLFGGDKMEFEEWDDGSRGLAASAPLRGEVLAGDVRLFYLLWLMAVEEEAFEADALEPMPGVAPVDGPLDAFADLLRDPRL